MNSSVSRQWLFERYAIKAVSVHGGGELFDKISFRDGRFAAHVCGREGMEIDMGCAEGASSPDIAPSSSSASQSLGAGLRDREDEFEDSGENVVADCFLLSMPLRKYEGLRSLRSAG